MLNVDRKSVEYDLFADSWKSQLEATTEVKFLRMFITVTTCLWQ